MTQAQWIFHYLEVMETKKDDVIPIKAILERLDDLDVAIQTGYFMHKDTGDRAKTLIDNIAQSRRDRIANKDKPVEEKPKMQDDEYPDILTDTDKELWSFMQEQPETIEETRDMRNTGKHILPTVSKADIIGNSKIVDDAGKEKEKFKLGF